MLLSRGISVNCSTCNSMIWEISRCDGLNSGYETFREVCGLNSEEVEGIDEDVKRVVIIRPNVHTFIALMVYFYREDLFEKVEDTWTEMERLGCEPDCYSVLLAVFCEEGRMKEAEKPWVEMREKNIQHDVVAYNTIIGGFCKIGEMGRAEEFFGAMGLSGFENSCVTFENLVNGNSGIVDADSAIVVYNGMCRKDFRLQGSVIEMLIEGLCDKKRDYEALEILGTGVENFGLFPTKKSYMLLIKGLCEDWKMEEVLKFQAEMVGKGFDPTLEIYNAFIDGYMKQENVKIAMVLRKEMLETQKR